MCYEQNNVEFYQKLCKLFRRFKYIGSQMSEPRFLGRSVHLLVIVVAILIRADYFVKLLLDVILSVHFNHVVVSATTC